MAVKLGIWSLTLIPGESYPMSVRKDFQITNAALGEDLKDKDGRSVIKVTHEPLPSAFFEASDSEAEYDSEIDGDLPSDEFELDSEEGFRKIDKKDRTTAANGDAAAADDEEDDEEDEDFEGDEDDEEEDDEDEDMSDLEDDELLETTVLCALTAGKIEQANLNITFTEGDVVMFEVTGDNAVHLMGNYLDQFPNEYDSDSDSEFDSDEQDDYADLDLDELSDEEEDEDVPVKGRITEVVEEAPKKVTAAIKAETKPAAQDKKRKAEVIDSPAAQADTSMTSTDGLSKNQKKKLAKKAKTDEAAAPAAAAAAAPAPKKENAQKAGKKVLPNGLEIEDVKVGTGPVAKPGKRCQMRYIGKLNNGKQFDANTAGAPFSFVLGRGEVIKGWDLGLNGMAVGGERKLVIPPALAYGKQKLPGLPANSTLNFEVKLLAVK